MELEFLFPWALTAVFAILKVCGFLDWGWFAVFSPLIVLIAYVALLVTLAMAVSLASDIKNLWKN